MAPTQLVQWDAANSKGPNPTAVRRNELRGDLVFKRGLEGMLFNVTVEMVGAEGANRQFNLRGTVEVFEDKGTITILPGEVGSQLRFSGRRPPEDTKIGRELVTQARFLLG